MKGRRRAKIRAVRVATTDFVFLKANNAVAHVIDFNTSDWRSGNNPMNVLDYYHIDWIKVEWKPATDMRNSVEPYMGDIVAQYDPDGLSFGTGYPDNAKVDKVIQQRPVKCIPYSAFARRGISLFVRNPRMTVDIVQSGVARQNARIQNQGVINGSTDVTFRSFGLIMRRFKPVSFDEDIIQRVSFGYTTWGDIG